MVCSGARYWDNRFGVRARVERRNERLSIERWHLVQLNLASASRMSLVQEKGKR